MNKMLVLGSDYGTLELVRKAKARGMYVYATDLMTTSPTKQAADEAWMISTTDLDTLEAKCRELGINDSMIHEDFMIGCDTMDIDALCADGSVKPIFRAGNWAF